MAFPIDLADYSPLKLDLSQDTLAPDQKRVLEANVRLARDSIVFFTALANAKGLGGHTGGAYDIVPEALIVDGFINGSDQFYPVLFDEAGHRVALQYLMAALKGHMPVEQLLHYREFGHGLYGHPERDDDRGVFFSSGRLGHLWSYVNGIALAHPDKTIFMFGSDGAQQEGGDAEGARFAVAQGLNVKLLIDDNDITITGHPSQYMPGFSVAETLRGHGLQANSGDGEDLDALYPRIRAAILAKGPFALVNRRPMAVGISGLEGSPKAHDVISVDLAIPYLKEKGRAAAVALLEAVTKEKSSSTYLGSTPETAKNRDNFGKIICEILDNLADRQQRVVVIDSDLEGSCGLHHIRKKHPEVYITGGIMERNNFSAAAGFGAAEGKQGIFGTFSAFLEMVVSEITMARLNRANVLAHFSHAGVDDMADNTCHFGINNFFADNGLAQGDLTRLYFPADSYQLAALIQRVFHDPGLRFVFSTRSATPYILKADGSPYFDADYQFTPGQDEVIREGGQGWVVSYGEMLYRGLDAVERLRQEGLDVGLINKPTLNVVDEAMTARMGAGEFVLVAETQNQKTGLGSRLGTWLLERGHSPRYAALGSTREGQGGLGEQIGHQGLAPADIQKKVRELAG
ncbi:MAG: transketolase C-terminal domain-containing protein [Desulfobacterales bacterium]|jgi:transketolase C-terminal domain/subunit/transketolase N-terminal domain/subunit